jgi:hypothetical protein
LEPFEEHLIIQIPLPRNKVLTVCCVYRSPSSLDANNTKLNELVASFDKIKTSYKLLLGDFNLSKICWNNYSASTPLESAFVDSIQSAYLHQHILEPTRGRCGQEPNILDLVFSNEENMISNISIESPLGKSDHSCVVFECHCFTKRSSTKRSIYLYNKGDYSGMANELNNINWCNILTNSTTPDSAYEAFTKVMETLAEKYVPKITLSNNKNKRRGLDYVTIRAIKKKHKAWQRYMETRSGDKYK